MAIPNPTAEHKKLTITLRTYGHDVPACMSISHGTLKDAATISFERTLRVPDNQVVNNLPPSLGQFPLFSVTDYKNCMPSEMVNKGGIFLPMYQREAMWIKFNSKEPFALKIYVGGVNAISGVPIKESQEAMLKRLQLSDKVKQDYIVLPDQPWLDGIASDDGRIRQFVAMPKGSGYSVEAHVTGAEKIDGIDGMQFELTPIRKGCPKFLKVKVFEGASRYSSSPCKERLLNLQEKKLSDASTILDLKKVIKEEFGLAVPDQELSLLILNNTMKSLNANNDQSMLAEISIPELVPNTQDFDSELASPVPMPFPAAGLTKGMNFGAPMKSSKLGMSSFAASLAVSPPAPKTGAVPPAILKDVSSSKPMHKIGSIKFDQVAGYSCSAPGQAARPVHVQAMSLAAGGLIKQSISADIYPASIWDTESTIYFNVQLLNSESFITVTGRAPPSSPISAETYQQHGYPFFDIWNEELTGEKGDFKAVKSVGEMDGSLSKAKKDAFRGNLTSRVTEDEELKRDEPLKFPVVILDMSLEMENAAGKLRATV